MREGTTQYLDSPVSSPREVSNLSRTTAAKAPTNTAMWADGEDDDGHHVHVDETPLCVANDATSYQNDSFIDASPTTEAQRERGYSDCVVIETANENWSVAHRFGFPCSQSGLVSDAEHQAQSMLNAQQAKCEQEWNTAVRGVPLLANATPEASEPLRRLARKHGFPMHLRAIMWMTLSGVALKMDENEGFCASLMARNGYMGGEPERCIEKDLERTFPDHPYFASKETGLLKLKHILHALCWRNPLLNYCQSFNFLAAVMLLILDDEEAVFWTMVYLLEELLPNDYYSEGLLGLKVDQEVFTHLLREHVPRLASHFASIHFDVRALIPAWLMSLFINTFPIETVIRVWDYMFSATPHTPTVVPLSIILVFMKLHQDELLRVYDSSDTMILLAHLSSIEFDGQRIVKAAHELKLTHHTMHALRRQYRAQIVKDQIERRQRQEAYRQRIAKQMEERLLAEQESATRSDGDEPISIFDPSGAMSSQTSASKDQAEPVEMHHVPSRQPSTLDSPDVSEARIFVAETPTS